jgi:PAS domain S-box-containing protein
MKNKPKTTFRPKEKTGVMLKKPKHQQAVDERSVELDAALARYFDLYNMAPVGYCTLNDKGLILEANFTASTLLGIPRGKLVKQILTRFIFKEDQDIYYLHRKKLFDTGEQQICELRMLKKNGTVFWAHLVATAANDEDGMTVCRIVMSDITGLKQAESQMETALEALRKSEKYFKEITENSTIDARILKRFVIVPCRNGVNVLVPSVYCQKTKLSQNWKNWKWSISTRCFNTMIMKFLLPRWKIWNSLPDDKSFG